MGFFQDLKQDLSQTVSDLEADDAMTELSLDNVEEQDSGDLFGAAEDTDFADLEAMLEKNVAAIDDELVKPTDLQENTMQEEVDMTDTINDVTEIEGNDMDTSAELKQETIEIAASEDQDQEVECEQALNVEEQNIEEPADTSPVTTSVDNFEPIVTPTDTAIITSKMSIVGDVTSSGSVKIGQSSVVIGNIFAASAVIAGSVKGDIDVQGPVILDASAIVMGNIKSKSVQINNGAVIEGMCSQCYADVNPTAFFDDVKKSRKIE